jgi:uncharacterized protein
VTSADIPVVYTYDGCEQLGMLHRPSTVGSIGVVIVPAGYQYRIGPYRQHVLLARAFGSAGIPSFRFDPPAIGDSGGAFLDFEMGDALAAAIDTFFAHCPELEGVVLWGICGSASVVAIHVPRNDVRVRGLILVNPWARSEQTLAKAYLKHYFARQLMDRNFWKKLVSGRVSILTSVGSFLKIAHAALRGSPKHHISDQPGDTVGNSATVEKAVAQPISERMIEGLESYSGETLIVLSSDDLTAQEFIEATATAPRWRKLFKSTSLHRLGIPGADHIFSEPEARELFVAEMVEWVKNLESTASDV